MEVRVLKDQKIRKQCIQFYWSFQRDGGCYKKIPSVREVHVWIFCVAGEPSRRASSQKQHVVNQLQISLQFLSSLADLKSHIRYTIVNQCFLPMAINC